MLARLRDRARLALFRWTAWNWLGILLSFAVGILCAAAWGR